MSNRTRTLIIAATLTAMHLAGMTAVAQAQATDQPTGRQATLRPPTERQVGESWRHRQAASQDHAAADATLQRVQARERFSIPSGTPAQVPVPVRTAEPSGQPESASPSPTQHPPRCRLPCPPSRAGSPAGSPPGWVCWLPPWCWQLGWSS